MELPDGSSLQNLGSLNHKSVKSKKRPLTGKKRDTNHRIMRERLNKDTQFTKKKDKTIRVKSHLSEKLALDQGKMFFSQVLDKHALQLVSKINQEELSKDHLRMAAYERVRRVVIGSFPQSRNISLAVFGSWATKMMTPYSDIDLMLCGFETLDRQSVVRALEVIEQNMKNLGWVVEIKGIYTASVPVIKIVSLFFRNLKFDLNRSVTLESHLKI